MSEENKKTSEVQEEAGKEALESEAVKEPSEGSPETAAKEPEQKEEAEKPQKDTPEEDAKEGKSKTSFFGKKKKSPFFTQDIVFSVKYHTISSPFRKRPDSPETRGAPPPPSRRGAGWAKNPPESAGSGKKALCIRPHLWYNISVMTFGKG